MKKIKLTFVLVFLFTICAKAQENKGFEFGFQLSEYQQDFGYGISITSPYVLKEYVAFRLRANQQFFSTFNNQGKVEWSPYQNFALGVLGQRSMIHEKIALYGEGGVFGILPNSDFSKQDFEIGGYGLFGFEFFFDKNFTYYIEAGGIGIDATADELPSEPIYSNGFLINVGFRIILNQNN